MMNLSPSDGLLLAVGAYVAVTSLVRLMRKRRDELVAELTREAEEQQRQKQLAEKESKKKQRLASGGRKAA
jgi:hypothetical protein